MTSHVQVWFAQPFYYDPDEFRYYKKPVVALNETCRTREWKVVSSIPSVGELYAGVPLMEKR